jgi:iron-sulfur cluster repair protein YtfE (RIC family)
MKLHELFTADHTALRRRIAELQATLAKNPEGVEALYGIFHQEVRAHFRKEDDVYYPHVDAGKRIQDRGLIHSLRNDHAAVVFALESLAIRLRKKVPLSEWTVKFDTMIKVLLPHFDQEEKNLFPEVERLLPAEELKSLFDKIQALE